jgi:predicted transcriptional regulator
MKKTIFVILSVLLWTVSSATAAPLKIGDKAPDFKLKDTLKKEWTLADPAWKGKVLLFNCMPTDEFKTNAAVSEAIYKDKEIDQVNKYAGSAIISAPSAVAVAPLRNAQRKMKKVFLMDNDDAVLKSWGFKPGVSTIVILDKDRICRYINSGKVPVEKVPELMKILKTYQAK